AIPSRRQGADVNGRWAGAVAGHVDALSNLPHAHLSAIAQGLGHAGPTKTKDAALQAISDNLHARIKGRRDNPKRLLSEGVRRFCGDKPCGKPECKACETEVAKHADPAPEAAEAPKLETLHGVEIFATGNHR